jgi:hypothetical protein
MPPTTRGPLPSGVYWRRRLALLSILLVVFLGLGKVIANGSDGSSGTGDKATQAGAATTASPTATAIATPKGDKGKQGKGKGKGKGDKASETPTPTPTPTPTVPVLPDPTGPCSDSDVFVTTSVASAVGGSDITFMLNLQAGTSEACTWQVSPDTIVMKISSGPDDVWLSEECPDAIPTQDVVVRRTSVTQVPVVWKDAKRSDEGCTGRTAWALPGFYHVYTAALGGEQTDVQFELVAPTAPTVTVTETVQPEGAGKGGGKGKGKGNR